MQVRIEESWKQVLQPEFDKPYFEFLTSFVRQEYQTRQCYPPASAIFRAFDLCPFQEVKAVILGQDPYHEPGQAMGLAFSVPQGVIVPPSLVNIYNEIQRDLGRPSVCAPSGDLTPWVKQGVLLLNATLTVQAHRAASHQNKGWEELTDAAIAALSKQREHIVFLLWGAYAQRKAQLIDHRRHLVLSSSHPSPLSVYRGFDGCGHFSKANAYLTQHNITPIEW